MSPLAIWLLSLEEAVEIVARRLWDGCRPTDLNGSAGIVVSAADRSGRRSPVAWQWLRSDGLESVPIRAPSSMSCGHPPSRRCEGGAEAPTTTACATVSNGSSTAQAFRLARVGTRLRDSAGLSPASPAAVALELYRHDIPFSCALPLGDARRVAIPQTRCLEMSRFKPTGASTDCGKSASVRTDITRTGRRTGRRGS